MRPPRGHGAHPRSQLSASEKLSEQLRSFSPRTEFLSEAKARRLEEQSWDLVPNLFQDLVGYKRPVLMEWHHREDNVLSPTMQDVSGKASASQSYQGWQDQSWDTDAGVRRVREIIEAEQPQHVWLSPPSEAFSPSQHVHQGTETQKQQLSTKRRDTVKLMVGVACIVHWCVQQGIHVSVEMPAKSDAWRLPVVQGLKRKYGLRFVTVQGCMVGLQNSQGQPVRQGWSVLTTHPRVEQMLDLPCKCNRQVKHGRTEGAHMCSYPKALKHRIARAVLHEGTHYGVVEECQGKTSLLEAFGEGEMCTCSEVTLPFQHRKCAACLVGRSHKLKLERGSEDVVEGIETEEECNFSQAECAKVEKQASELQERRDYSHEACQNLIGQLPNKHQKHHRGAILDEHANILTLGAYAHGNHYGLTSWTRRLPQSFRYLVQYLKHWSPEEVFGSTIFVSKDSMHGVHRDVHNLPCSKNYLIGVTSFKQGELWLEGPGQEPKQPQVSKVTAQGQEVQGHLRSVEKRVVVFDARKWHASQPWEGTRWLVGAYTSRGSQHLAREDIRYLRQTGLMLPPKGPPMDVHFAAKPAETPEPQEGLQGEGQEEQALAGEVQRSGREDKREVERIKRKLYLLHAATGHGSVRHMVEALRRRKASPLVLQLAQQFKCSICQERAKVQPRQVSSLEPLPPKFHTISADIGHWVHPASGEHQNFMVVIDEGSRFRTAKILLKGQKQAPTSAACINYLQEVWFQVFGKPKTLRLDPAGSFRSSVVESFCDRHSIYHDVIPGEAHWQIGLAEQAVQGLKLLMTKICEADPSTPPEEALSTAVSVFNQKELVRAGTHLCNMS